MTSLKLSQRGFTLIEILIALTLSIIIILAMLRAFVTTGKVTAEASFGAKTDSSLMLDLIAVDRVLQGVGYNVNNPAIKSHTFPESADGAEYLVWKITDTECRALKNVKVTDSADGGLYVYGTDSSGYGCSDTLAKPDLVANHTLKVERLVHIEKVIKTSKISNDSNKIGSINIELKDLGSERCTPFGVAIASAASEAAASEPVVSGGKYQVVISINTYAASTETTARTIENTTCLFNFK
ncbi:prepilin-type N-terminal cleavage/methylation domain-containing protein [Acinetobacter indicus]|uniref:prepilin-type N-terminal cleavage/methylation domain-containing protein n=1 Tax=Acinetobacter indicus TaxID=756892 RepID=UPI0012E1F089|nr:prepilin-type N-terminal cleavage/methylation domain-containing protein [Acinetobacter indicus]